MHFIVNEGLAAGADADVLIVGCFSGEGDLASDVAAIDEALSGAISRIRRDGDFTGKRGETSLLYTHGQIGCPRVLLAGLGERDKFGPQVARSTVATAVLRAREMGLRSVACLETAVGVGIIEPDQAGQMVVEGALLGLYRFAGYKSQAERDTRSDPEKFTLYAGSSDHSSALARGLARGEAVAQGVVLARDLVSEPANYMTPTILAERAAQWAAANGLTCRVLDREEIEAQGMGIFLAVSAASEQPPKFIILEHNAGRADLPTVVLVGKGVTFDSGGISLKPNEGMWEMKGDMAGAAAVIGALGVAARLQLPVHAVALAPCAENLPGGGGQKPGDVYRGMLGKTMEVISTDAEGRMLLADALAYAAQFSPSAVVDIATLTGSQSIALGPQAAAFFTPEETLATRLTAAADTSGERLWRFPLYDEYAEGIKSQVADVKNSSGKYAGVGTSAKFLQHFTEGYPWAHIDMASMNWSEEDQPGQPRGATGYGVRLLLAFLEGWA